MFVKHLSITYLTVLEFVIADIRSFFKERITYADSTQTYSHTWLFQFQGIDRNRMVRGLGYVEDVEQLSCLASPKNR